MIDSSPITAWEGAKAIFTFAGTGGAAYWFWIMAILLLVPLYVAFKAEKNAEKDHG